MFGKMNMGRFKNSMSNIKRTVGRHAATLGKRYVQVKDGVNTLDKHMHTAKSVYNDPQIQSSIKELTGEKLSSNINKGLSNYDQVRNRVVSTHNDVERHTNNVVGGLKKNGVSIGIY